MAARSAVSETVAELTVVSTTTAPVAEPIAPKPVVSPVQAVLTKAPVHPSSLGRADNDPRENPGKPIELPVLQPGVALSAAPMPSSATRNVGETHPSLVGRVTNDPRGASQTDEPIQVAQ